MRRGEGEEGRREERTEGGEDREYMRAKRPRGVGGPESIGQTVPRPPSHHKKPAGASRWSPWKMKGRPPSTFNTVDTHTHTHTHTHNTHRYMCIQHSLTCMCTMLTDASHRRTDPRKGFGPSTLPRREQINTPSKMIISIFQVIVLFCFSTLTRCKDFCVSYLHRAGRDKTKTVQTVLRRICFEIKSTRRPSDRSRAQVETYYAI